MLKNTGISGQLQGRPEMPALHQLLSQALENRGRQMQVMWHSPGSVTFTLFVICNVRGDPRWCLYRDQGGRRELVFDHSSCDVLLVKNLIVSSCAELDKVGRSSFLSSGKAQKLQEPGLQSPDVENNVTSPGEIAQASAGRQLATAANNTPVTPMPGDPRASATGLPLSPPPVVNGGAGAVDPAESTDTADEASSEILWLNPRSLDADAIESVMVSLRNQDTGMFMYPAFLYFLEQEYFRILRSRASLAIIVFEMCQVHKVDGEIVRTPLPPAAVTDAAWRLTELKRHVDVLAHYDGSDYAFLLPNTRTVGARAFAERMMKALTTKPLGALDPSTISVALGSASIPEDFGELGKLLGAAELAMKAARTNDSHVVMFGDIKDSVKLRQ